MGGTTGGGKLSHDGLERLHALMAAKVDKGEVPGLVYLVAHGDEVHVEVMGRLAFGDGPAGERLPGAAPTSSAPMRRDTIFRVASLTKPVLAAAAMMLVDEGRLPLDAPVERWLPELADRRVLRRIDGP